MLGHVKAAIINISIITMDEMTMCNVIAYLASFSSLFWFYGQLYCLLYSLTALIVPFWKLR